MFRDVELKINYHKERIIQSFIKKGIFPNNKLIQSELDNIETRLAIFKNSEIKEGSIFDTDSFNEAINDIYNDLKILYQLLYKVTVEEYNKLDYYINSHLAELNTTANMYAKRAELESYSTSIGKSILFKHNEFEVNKKDGFMEVNLGTVSINDAAKIVCIASVNNTDHEDIVFRFKNNKSNISCNSYTYNHDFVVFPGEQVKKEFPIVINESQNINSLLELPVILDNNKQCKFITMAGKNKISYKKANVNGEVIEEKPIAINALSFSDHAYIDFYVVGGNSITFRFNKKPVATNFNINSNVIDNLDHIHHFFIECDADFSFDFELDKGDVYAIKENTITDQDNLYYSGHTDVKDFLLIQISDGPAREYDVTMEVHNTSMLTDDIESVMIKKIN